MPIILFPLVILIELAVIAVWLWQHVEMRRIRRERLVVETGPRADPLPSLTVIIPARNESRRITEGLRSVLAQDLPDLRVVVADDRSDDDTAALVRRIAGEDDRFSVHRIDSLPPGWLGKSHALWSAAQEARSEWLLFLDADCRLLPGGLSAALEYAVRRRADMLSLWPRDGGLGFWERLLIPLCGAMIVIWYGTRKINDPACPEAFANGAFILVRRAAYLRAGGHGSVKAAIIEDIPFARHMKAAGHSVLNALGPDVYSVRMYESLSEVVRGWQRIYLGVLTKRQIVLCMLSILVGSLLPFVLLPVSVAGMLRQADGPWTVLAGLSLAHLAALFATSVRFFSLARCRLRYLWLYPLSCFGVLYILGAALFQSFGRSTVQWRDTTYQVESSTIRN
ncbi:MAG: glycosyltransferase [Phycisphaerae bacterium]